MNYRAEIDGLRAFAVLSVVIFHAFPSALQGGFIGVDVFFVISGFLISKIIFEEHNANIFSFSKFFVRRVKRIFPALIVVTCFSLLFGWFFLLSEEFSELGIHVASGVLFVLNFVLANESGYFENAAETKPMLHLWSLSVEEQFYLVWPLFIWLAWKWKFNFLIIGFAVFFLSFATNVAYVYEKPTHTFFWSIGRFWEFAAGAFLAWISVYRNKKCGCDSSDFHGLFPKLLFLSNYRVLCGNVLSVLGFSCLLFSVFFIHDGLYFPGYYALLPVAGSVMIIAAGSNAGLNRVLLMNPLAVWIGLISYPLYLWHWPVFSFLQILKGDFSSYVLKVSAILLSFVFAWLTFKYIEIPLRRNKSLPYQSLILVIMLFCIGFGGLLVYKEQGFPDRSLFQGMSLSQIKELRAGNRGFGECEYSSDEACTNSSDPDVLLWGDSYAMHLTDALLNSSYPIRLKQITKSACRPLLNTSVIYGRRDQAWAEECIDHNKSVYNYVKENSNLEYVIMASPFSYSDRIIYNNKIVNASDDIWFYAIKNTVEQLKEIGLKVIVIAPPPSKGAGYDLFNCWVSNYRLFGFNQKCDFGVDEISSERKDTYNLLKQVESVAPVVYLKDFLCDQSVCQTILEDRPLYRDEGHLSKVGSKWLGEQFNFSEVVIKEADLYWGNESLR